MGSGDIERSRQEGGRVSTMHLILVLLRDSMPRALSTYEIGLAITDDKEPPRPMSVLIKTLSKDKYVRRTALLGKRAGLWTITERGLQSLERRPQATAAAEDWLSDHMNLGADELTILIGMKRNGPQAASRMASCTGLLHSPVRTALKKLQIRGLVRHRRLPESQYRLTKEGRSLAARLVKDSEENELS